MIFLEIIAFFIILCYYISSKRIVMPQEDYSKAINAILSMTYQQRLSLLYVLSESLQETEPAPKSITVSSVQELHKKLDESLEDIKVGRFSSAESVRQRLSEKYGI